MATTGWVAAERTATSLRPRLTRARARLVLGAATTATAAAFVALTAVYLLDPAVVLTGGFAVAWWGACLATPLLGVAACVAGSEPEDDHGYLGTLVDGLRREWGHRG